MIDNILLQSAGTFSVAVIALMMAVIQLIFAFRQPSLTWYLWGAALSFAGLLYAAGAFLEYNLPAGPANRCGGLLEFTAHVFLVHGLYGLSFSYLNLKGRLYHLIAGAFHVLLLGLLWFTPLIVSDRFVSRDFIGLAEPFVESALGPLGPWFMMYIAAAALVGIVLWFRSTNTAGRHRIAYLAGLVFWLALGIHDALAVLGLPTFQYVMEYGFLGFSCAVLWAAFDNYTDQMAQDKYRVITEFANDGLLVIQDEQTVFENPACSAILGQPVMDLTIRNFLQIVAPEDSAKVLQYYGDMQSARDVPDAFIFRIVRPGGAIRHLEIRASSIRYGGRPAILTVMRDVTRRLEQEAALRKQEEKTAQLKKMESLRLLARSVAHDLNNVLSTIVSYPELLLMDLPENSPLRKPLEVMRDSGMRASSIVSDLSMVARGAAAAKESLNLNSIIHSTQESSPYRELLRRHSQVTVQAKLDDRPLEIAGSFSQLQKVVLNLLTVACEAMATGGSVSLATTLRPVDRSIEDNQNDQAGEYAVLIVKDRGPEIPPDDLKRIFEPFYTKKVMGRGGTGLELTVAWNIVHDHEGYIDVASGCRGTTWEVYLPLIGKTATDAAAENLPDALNPR
ncbi:MAG: PAS domain S-box protein [Syntrophaceae bacterium]|nr:PAS domain S-box protein [Syntrophaceae bacterium]